MIDRIGRLDSVTCTVAAQYPNLKVGWHLVPAPCSPLFPCTLFPLFLHLVPQSVDARRRPAAVARRDRQRYK